MKSSNSRSPISPKAPVCPYALTGQPFPCAADQDPCFARLVELRSEEAGVDLEPIFGARTGRTSISPSWQRLRPRLEHRRPRWRQNAGSIIWPPRWSRPKSRRRWATRLPPPCRVEYRKLRPGCSQYDCALDQTPVLTVLCGCPERSDSPADVLPALRLQRFLAREWFPF